MTRFITAVVMLVASSFSIVAVASPIDSIVTVTVTVTVGGGNFATGLTSLTNSATRVIYPTSTIAFPTSSASTTAVCNPDDFRPLRPQATNGTFLDADWVLNHRVLYLPSGDFDSVDDFRAKCEGECGSSAGIGGPACLSYYMAFGTPDYAHAWPNPYGASTTNPEWMCQGFNATLTPDLYRRTNKKGFWTFPSGANAC